MKKHELDSDAIRLTIRVVEDGVESEPLILVPSHRMARLISRSVAGSIPTLACNDEAAEATAMCLFIDDFLGAEVTRAAA